MNLNTLSDKELINLYPALLNELKKREIIRTKNMIGELGEYLAQLKYQEVAGLPKLQLGIRSTKNIDAIGSNGERYAIKSTSTNSTGVFHSIPIKDDGVVYFEYLIIVIFSENYELKSIYEMDWQTFLRLRKLKKPENKYYISVTNELKKIAKRVS